MINKIPPSGKNKTVGDLRNETTKLLVEEMGRFKKGALTKKEQDLMKVLAEGISNSVLKEMKIV